MLSWKIFASNWDWTSHCMYSFTATSATCFMVTGNIHSYWASGAGRVAYIFPGDAGAGFCALLLALLIGIPLGILSAVWRNRWLDHLVRIMAITGISTPAFWLGLGVIVLFYGHLQILPGGGRLDDWLIHQRTLPAFICSMRCLKATVKSSSMRCNISSYRH